jgi:hypothetical protein
MGLLDRLRRWWSPAQWNEDHPLAAEERSTEGRRSRWWSDAAPRHGAGRSNNNERGRLCDAEHDIGGAVLERLAPGRVHRAGPV